MTGTWMQSIALSWLVIKKLDGHGHELGLLSVFQFGPMLVLGAWAGAIADRVDKRKVMMVTQILLGVAALALGILDLTNHATLSSVLVIACISGFASAFDTPVRRAMVGDLVPKSALPNAMSLNTGVITSTRVFGMALGGFVTKWAGTGWCFVGNGISYLAMLLSLLGLGTRAHQVIATTNNGARDAIRYIRHHSSLRIAMGVTVVVATFAFNYGLTFPLLISEVFHRDSDGLGGLMAITSIGSFSGAVISARRRFPSLRLLLFASVGMGLSGIAVGGSPNIWLCVASAAPMGACGGLLMSQLSGLLTTQAPAEMRGRVLALQSVIFIGSTPIGGPIIGSVADSFGPRWATISGGIASVIAGLIGLAAFRAHQANGTLISQANV